MHGRKEIVTVTAPSKASVGETILYRMSVIYEKKISVSE